MPPLEVTTALPEGSLFAIDCEAARQLADAVGIWTDLDYGANELARLQEAIKRDPRTSGLSLSVFTTRLRPTRASCLSGRS